VDGRPPVLHELAPEKDGGAQISPLRISEWGATVNGGVARDGAWQSRGARLGGRGTRGSGRGTACAGARAWLEQRRVASNGTEAAVREGGRRMSGVSFLREMGAAPTQVKPRPDRNHGSDACGSRMIKMSFHV